MKRATIKDISKIAGVNPSTVSRALNNHPDISNELKKAIKQIAENLNYIPNKIASNFRNKSNKTLALIIPEINMFFFPSVINGISKVAKSNGYQLIVLQSNENEETEIENIKTCIDNRVSGIMISLSRNTESMMHINSALAFGIPVIFFDKAPLNGLYDTIKIDDVRVGYKATQFLKENGANKIAGLFGHPNMSITRDRLLGFNKAVSEFGLNLISIKHTLNRQEAIEETKELVEEGVEGIFAMSDEIISGIIPGINLCETLKRKKPKIIGISDGQLPYFFNEEINFLHHDGELAGLRAAEKLLEKIENPESSKNIFTHIIETPIKCNLKSDLKILPV